MRKKEGLYIRASFAYNKGIQPEGGKRLFNIGATELILLLLIAFIVVGPKDLPKVARSLGKAVRSIRGMIAEVKREAGLDELEGEMKGVQHEVQSTLKGADVRADLRKAEREIDREVSSVKKELNFKDFKNTHQAGGKKE